MPPDRRLAPLLALALPLLPSAARADAVLDWNEIALAQVVAARELPPDGARSMAMVHVAIFDAVAAIEGGYAPLAFHGHAPNGALPEAAAAAAARGVLVALFPDRTAPVEAAYATALATLPAGEATRAGVAVGEAAAATCLALREGDGAKSPERYRPRTLPGVYVPTPIPVSSEWQHVALWLGGETSRFRPAPPPELASALWARDYEEVREVGRRESARRTPVETEAARFWTITGPAAWNPVVRALAASRPAPVVANARLFALANLAAADAFAAVFEAKYAYAFWRPITAIRNGDRDGNDATLPDAGWLPLVDTPLHPEYPCAHCITAGAIAEVLESEFGKGEIAPIEMTSPTAPGVTHRWTRLADYVAEVNQARIWGGIHYRNSTEVGEAMGRAIGDEAVRTLLTRATR